MSDEIKPQTKTKKPISTTDKIKFAGLIAFFLLIVVLSVFVISFIRSMGDGPLEEELQKAIEGAGIFGVLICLAIQFIQIVVAFIPGEIVQVVIGYVYGTLGGGFITLAGALLSSIFVFYVVRKLGAPFVQGMLGNKETSRVKFLQNSKNLNSLVFILYLIPALPKDLFTYVFPLTKIRPEAFFVLSTLGRAPAIFASTFVAEAFKSGNYVQMIIVAAIFGTLGILGIIFNQKIMAFADKVVEKIPFGKHTHEKNALPQEVEGGQQSEQDTQRKVK